MVRLLPHRLKVWVSDFARLRAGAATLFHSAFAATVFFGVASCGGGLSSPLDIANDVVATFSGGQILRTEIGAAPAAAVEPITSLEIEEDEDTEAGDWRLRKIHNLVTHKVLVASVENDDVEFLARRQAAIDSVLHSSMVSHLAWHNFTLTEAELRTYYEENPERFKDPEKLRMQHVFLRADSDSLSPAQVDEIRIRIERIRQTLLDGADFTAIARQHSESDTAAAGGWMTLAADARVFPSFTEEAWDLEIGEVSEIIDTPHGFHVVVLRERRPAFNREFEDVREFTIKRARGARLVDLQHDFIAEVGPRHNLARHYERIDDPFIENDDALFEIEERAFTFRELAEALPDQYEEHLYNGFLPKVIENLDLALVNRLLVAEAKRIKLDEEPVVKLGIQVKLDELKYQIGLERRLQALATAVPDAELRGYFWQNRERYQSLRNYDLSLIQLRPDDGEELWSVLRRAEALAGRIRAGEDFATLARAHSRHYSARDGGQILSLTDKTMSSQVQSTAKYRRLMAALADGELSDPFFSECYNPGPLRFEITGVMIVRLDHTIAPNQLEFEEAEDMAREQYRRRHHARLVEEVTSTIVDEVNLKINTAALPPL